jgi:hypothetical protein
MEVDRRGSVVPQPTCSCGTYAIGVCASCGAPVCAHHSEVVGHRRMCLRELREERDAETERRKQWFVAQYQIGEEKVAAERRQAEQERQVLLRTMAAFLAAMAAASFPGTVSVTMPPSLGSEGGESARGDGAGGGPAISAAVRPSRRLRRLGRPGRRKPRAWVLSMPFERRLHPRDPASTWHRWALLTDGRLALLRDEQKARLEAFSRKMDRLHLEAELARASSPTRRALDEAGRSPLVQEAAGAERFFDCNDLSVSEITSQLRSIARQHRLELPTS